jgi:tetratricopeptide (TPR) repeat protein
VVRIYEKPGKNGQPAEEAKLYYAILALAAALQDAGEHARAVSVYDRGLLLGEKRHGKDSSDLAGPLLELAVSLEKLTQYDRAEAAIRRAIQVSLTERLHATPIADARLALGRLHAHLGQWPRAEGELAEAVRTVEQQSGSDSLDLVEPLMLLGDVQISLLDHAAARRTLERALKLAHRSGEDSTRFALALAYFGTLDTETGNLDEATEALARAGDRHEEDACRACDDRGHRRAPRPRRCRAGRSRDRREAAR